MVVYLSIIDMEDEHIKMIPTTSKILDLPDDILMEIFRYIPPEEAILISPVCKRFNACWWKERRAMSLKYVQEKMKEGRMDLIEYCGGKRMREVFQLSSEQGLDDVCMYAARGGHLKVLRWARENGCPWDHLTCAYAAGRGHLEILQWARGNGCSWNEWTCGFAASNGHLEVLKWLRREKDPCPWNEWTCAHAAKGGHLKVLRWARENGCPWDEHKCIAVAKNDEIRKWIEVFI
jgi:hypothetical protein